MRRVLMVICVVFLVACPHNARCDGLRGEGDHPVDMDRKIEEYQKAGKTVCVVAFTAKGGWVVGCTDGTINAGGPPGSRPAAMDKQIEAYQQAGKTVDVVAFGDNGAWIVGTTRGDMRGAGRKPEGLDEEIVARQKAGFKITVAAFTSKGWVLGWKDK
jgi:hypothetical protein